MASRSLPAPSRGLPIRRDAVSVQAVVAVALLAVGITVWSLSLSSIQLDEMDDYGLASVLPPGVWLGTVLVAIGCAVAWWSRSEPLMLLGVLATILVLYGVGVLGEPTMRLNTPWQHVGIADYIATQQQIDPGIDAYFNWPGFFALGAFLSSILGLDNIEPVARYATLYLNVLYLLPLVAIGRSLFRDPRVVWLGIWLFYVCDWFGQDYFSPQGLAFFLYLVVLAVLLRWFKGIPRSGVPRRRWHWERLTQRLVAVPDAPTTPGQRVLLVAVIALIAGAIVASHQLTPFALVAATAALVLVGWVRLQTLPVAFLLMALTWAAYMAITYLTGHIQDLASDVGALHSTFSANASSRVAGSAGHQVVVKIRLITMALVWALAFFAFARSARRRELSPGLVALALGPFAVVALQSYGGEVLMRVALFTMPFMTLSVASLFAGREGGRRPSTPALTFLACVAVLLLAAWPFNRYGNERMDSYTKAELTATQTLYRLAPQGSALYATSWALPWRYQHYADYYYYNSLTEGEPYLDLDDPDPDRLVTDVIEHMTQSPAKQSFLIITKSTSAQNDLFGPASPGAQQRLQRILTASPRFRTVYQNPDATIFLLQK